MTLIENYLSHQDRRKLNDDEFGIPEERKYPLHDKSHVRSAIRFFKYAEPKHRKELAKNIEKAIDKFDMDVNISKGTALSHYINNSYTMENYLSRISWSKINIDIGGYIKKENGLINEIKTNNNDGSDIFCRRNSILNKSFDEILDFNEYMGDNENNYILLSIYQDIIKAISEMNSDIIFNHICNILDILSRMRNLDHIKYLIRNIYSIIIRNQDNKYYNKLNIYVYKLINNIDKCDGLNGVSYKDISEIIHQLSIINYTDNIEKFLEKSNDNIYDEYINFNNNDIDEYGNIIEKADIHISENHYSIDEFYDIIQEGLDIDRDGNIKISLTQKGSYMDQYSDAHKILAENYKNKNYDAMKTNLAFMFSLISKIERDKRYKDRDPEVVKARAFAINDFKTYLAKLQEAEPDFNFVEYYKSSDIGKFIIYIPRETIVGIKKLFKTIMM